ncbi:MAG: Asp-tRNA(Asn)/Glu-tRNA(Gln) amidotransferase subunit GatC, partial [Bacteroidota bacterium]
SVRGSLSMPVSIRDVEHVAGLARLSFSEEEKEKLAGELNEILHYMEQLNRLNTTHVDPLFQVVELSNALRDDVLRPSLPREDILRNAPAKTEQFFKVPKVLGER